MSKLIGSAEKVRLTAQTRAVLEAIRDGQNWGTAIIKKTGVSMSAVYATLKTAACPNAG